MEKITEKLELLQKKNKKENIIDEIIEIKSFKIDLSYNN
jgi:hypothetical protein